MIKHLDIQIAPFKQRLSASLGHLLLSPKLISTISNMLALDFATRGSSESIEAHAASCADNLTNYITTSSKNFDDSFASATILFSAAITTAQDNYDIKSLNQIQNKGEVASACVEIYMPEIEGVEKDSLKDALAILLESDEADSLVNFIADNPKLAAAINAKYVKKIRKIGAHIIANEIATVHAQKRNTTDSNINNLNLIQSLVKDLSGHISNKEYNPKELAALKKVAGLERNF